MVKHTAKHSTHSSAANPALDNTALTVPDSEKNPTVGQSAKATEPWEAESDPNHPVHRGILAVHKRRKGYQTRWVNENAVDRRKIQGYTLADPKDYDVEGVDGKVKRNEMVLMEIPMKLYLENRAGVNRRTEELARSAKSEFRREVAKESRGQVSVVEEGSDEE